MTRLALPHLGRSDEGGVVFVSSAAALAAAALGTPMSVDAPRTLEDPLDRNGKLLEGDLGEAATKLKEQPGAIY